MKREELISKGYTEEQASELLDMFHANMKNVTKQNETLQNEIAVANEKIAGLSQKEQELNQIKQSQLTESEKVALKEKEIETRLQEASKRESEARKVLNEAKAKVILAEIGGVSDNILKSIVTDDEEVTIQNANELLNQFKSFKEETVLKTKEELSSLDIKPAASNSTQDGGAMTWEKFETLSEDEQIKFQEEHPDEFANL